MDTFEALSPETDAGEPVIKRRRVMKPRSWCWRFFNRDRDNNLASCNLCSYRTVYRVGDSTTLLIYHLSKSHEIHKFQQGDKKKLYANVNYSESDSESNEDNDTPNTVSILSDKRIAAINRALMKFIICTCQPLSIAQNDYFRGLIAALNPNYKIPCKNIIRDDLIPEMVHTIQRGITLKIGKTKCAITTDCWTSIAQYPYLGVTCHFIDPLTFKLTSHIISFKFVPEAKTAEFLHKSLVEIFSEWKISEKVVAIVSDSGANIFAATAMFPQDIKKIPCAGHRINLCVNDMFKIRKVKTKKIPNQRAKEGFFVKSFDVDGKLLEKQITEEQKVDIEQTNRTKEDFEKIIAKCRHLVGSFKHSDQLVKKLGLAQIRCGIKARKLVQDVAHRWNSCYSMLESICLNEKALRRLANEPENKKIADYCPTEAEVASIVDVCNILQPLKELTDLFSGSKYPTITVLYPTIYNLVNHELDEVEITDSSLALLRDDLIYSLSGRFNYVLTDDFFLAATMLDFRFRNFEFIHDEAVRVEKIAKAKSKLIELSQLFKNQQSEVETSNRSTVDSSLVSPIPSTNSISSSSNTNSVSSKTNSVGSNAKTSNSNNASSTPFSSSNKRKRTSCIEKLADKSIITISTDVAPIEEEIENYLKHKIQVDANNQQEVYELGALYFYKYYHHNYSILTELALSILCITGTSVPSEELFSRAGNVEDDLRNRLNPFMLEKIMLFKENIGIYSE